MHKYFKRTVGWLFSAKKENSGKSADFNKLHLFLSNKATDNKNRYLKTIQANNDYFWEESHDFIQWVFPLLEPSQYNYTCPIITHEEFQLLRKDKIVCNNMKLSFNRYLNFLGLEVTPSGKVQLNPVKNTPKKVWLRKPDHNHLRITRMLKCMVIFGYTNMAEQLVVFLKKEFALLSLTNESIAESLQFWEAAVK